MFRPAELKTLIRGQGLITSIRSLSAEAARAPATDSKFQDEWNNAKPFESIPALTVFGVIRSFLPGGRLCDA